MSIAARWKQWALWMKDGSLTCTTAIPFKFQFRVYRIGSNFFLFALLLARILGIGKYYEGIVAMGKRASDWMEGDWFLFWHWNYSCKQLSLSIRIKLYYAMENLNLKLILDLACVFDNVESTYMSKKRIAPSRVCNS